METVIVTTESAIEKIMERVLDKKLPKPPESDVEKTYSINQVVFESSIKEYNNK